MISLQETVIQKLERMTSLKYYTFCGYARNCWLLLLKALGIGVNDEVIVPGFACQSIYQAIYDVGATPVFVDVNVKSINISPYKIENAITTKTKAIYVIHSFGFSAEIDKISKAAKDHSIYLVEDISHALNCTYDYRQLGSYGHFAICSLTKTMVNYQGGFVATNDHTIHTKIQNIQLNQSLNQSGTHFSYYIYRLLCSLWECNGSLIALIVFKFLSYLNGNNRIQKLHNINCDYFRMEWLALYITDRQLSKQNSDKYASKRNKSFYKFRAKYFDKINFPEMSVKQTGLMPNHHCGMIDLNTCEKKFSLCVWSNTDIPENLVNSKKLYEKLRMFYKRAW